MMRIILLVLVVFLIGSGSAQCDIPTLSEITSQFENELQSIVGEGSINANLIDYKYTCKAISALNKFSFVSVAVNYTEGGSEPNYGRFEMQCLTFGVIVGWESTGEWTTEDKAVFSIETQVNCFSCKNNLMQEAHCEVCEGCSDVGIGACTGPNDCCYYFDIDGSCIEECPDDYSPDVDTFQCVCSLRCSLGESLFTDNCTCIPTHICLINDPCQNGGTCNVNSGSDMNYTCTCVNYSGVNCTECSKSCDEGYKVNDSCVCIPTHICLINDPCQNGGTCNVNSGSDMNYTCTCVNYSGVNCTECSKSCDDGYKVNDSCVCIPTHICLINDPCQNGGTCNVNSGSDTNYTCTCVNYSGMNCTECSKSCDDGYKVNDSCVCIPTHICLIDDPCQNGGTCNVNSGSDMNYTCTCVNYSGVNCTECSKSCDDGYKVDDSCVCIPTHICLINDPCQNGGTCNVNSGSDIDYTCECAVDYDGIHCTECSKSCSDGYEADNDCNSCVLSDICEADDPCDNGGTCILDTKPDVYQCNCAVYYNGTNCTECTLDCQNGGSRDDNCSCHCAVGYTGDTCDKEIDYCIGNPCGSYGACTNSRVNYTCACSEGWKGSNCDGCSIQYCTECTGIPSVCKECDNNYVVSSSGKSCELQDLCPLMPCQNGGTCSGRPGSYECSCPDTWTGVNCTECSDGYGIRNKQCVVCDDDHCLICDDDYTMCKDCDSGYSRSSNGECVRSRDGLPTIILIWIIIGCVVGFLLVVAIFVIIVMGFIRCANRGNERKIHKSSTTKNPIVSENPLYISEDELEKEDIN